MSQSFWTALETHSSPLASWNGQSEPSPELREACHNICQTLRHPQSPAEMADPRNMARVQSFRAQYADKWSAFNSMAEYQAAEELAQTCQTYEDFLNNTRHHWLFKEYQDLIDAELTMLTQNGLNLAGAKVCMVGPGAIPYTGMSLSARGAHITLVDMYGPACTWSRQWMQRFFPHQPWTILQQPGQSLTFSEYDLVIVASMLFGRADVLKAVNATPPRHVLVRSTSGKRPMSLLLPQVPYEEFSLLKDGVFVAESTPPLHVGNIAFLYTYLQA